MARAQNELKWEFDLKSIQRAITPLVILEILSDESDLGLGAALIGKKVEKKLEEDIAEFNPPRFELYPSVLYPMLAYMKDTGKWIELHEDTSYRITKEGQKQLEHWRIVFQALAGVKHG